MSSLPRTKVIPEGLQRAIEGMKNLRRDDREDLTSGCPVSVKPKRIIDLTAELKQKVTAGLKHKCRGTSDSKVMAGHGAWLP